MKRRRVFFLLTVLTLAAAALAPGPKNFAVASTRQAQQQQPAARVLDLKASDGTLLKASYFAAAKPGPGVLLFHQTNRTRKTWDDVAVQLGGLESTRLLSICGDSAKAAAPLMTN